MNNSSPPPPVEGADPERVREASSARPFRLTSDEQTRFERAIAGIDVANSADPTWIYVDGRDRPKELAMAERVSEKVLELRPHASLELRLAARAHHIRRWQVPRQSFPAGLDGYLRWRGRLQQFHAEQTGILLAGEGYPEDTILRVQMLIRKTGLARDPEVQALEDAICLVFFEMQLEELCDRIPQPKLETILIRTLHKMSAEARDRVAGLDLTARARAAIDSALATCPESDVP